MQNHETRPEIAESEATAGPVHPTPTTTRLAFIGNVGKKAAYVTPVFMTLQASQVMAASGPSPGGCKMPGSPCAVQGDCCQGFPPFDTDQLCESRKCCIEDGEAGCVADADCCAGFTCVGGTCE